MATRIDDDDEPSDDNLREVLNYVRAAEHAFSRHADGRPLTIGLLTDLQAMSQDLPSCHAGSIPVARSVPR